MNSRKRRPPAIPEELREYIRKMTWNTLLEIRETLQRVNYATCYDEHGGLIPIVRYRLSTFVGMDGGAKWIQDYFYEGVKYRTLEAAVLEFAKDYPQVFYPPVGSVTKRKKKVCA